MLSFEEQSFCVHAFAKDKDVYKRQPHHKVNDGTMDTNEHMILEELWYKIEDTYFTSKEIVIHTQIIRTTSAEKLMDHG